MYATIMIKYANIMCIAVVSPCPVCEPELPCVSGAAQALFTAPLRLKEKTQR